MDKEQLYLISVCCDRNQKTHQSPQDRKDQNSVMTRLRLERDLANVDAEEKQFWVEEEAWAKAWGLFEELWGLQGEQSLGWEQYSWSHWKRAW